MPEPRTVLFLCTANYYRSRFAEALFNHEAARRRSSWRALSAGLAEGCQGRNPGALSPYTRAALAARAIEIGEPVRAPLDVTVELLESATHIVALKEAEHRPLLQRRFPEWAERVVYWHVHDLDQASADEALAAIESRVVRLIAQLDPGAERSALAGN